MKMRNSAMIRRMYSASATTCLSFRFPRFEVGDAGAHVWVKDKEAR